MTVRELIIELLEHDLDHNVQVLIETNRDSDWVDVETILASESNKEVYFEVEIERTLITSERMEELEALEDTL